MMTHGLQTDITVLFYNSYSVKNKISSELGCELSIGQDPHDDSDPFLIPHLWLKWGIA